MIISVPFWFILATESHLFSSLDLMTSKLEIYLEKGHTANQYANLRPVTNCLPNHHLLPQGILFPK